jgi:hypothetical protein
MELLESLPVRLEAIALADIIRLTEEGKTARSIAWRLSLDPLVVTLETRRHNERRAHARAKRRLTGEQKAARKAEAGMPRLERFEMNRLARGTHIPNQPLRELIAAVQNTNPELTLNALLTAAGYESSSEGRRLLGYMRVSGSPRYGQTISPEHAARVVRALGRDPREVAGL